jgi:uncharacterized protein
MMSSNRRYVFDTNVLISALLFGNSTPGRAFFTALAQGVILVSLPLIAELDEVLNRPKFERYVTREERERFLEALIREATLVEIDEVIQICRDPKDDKVLELAVSGQATYVITGDEDLLTLSPFRGIPILTPQQFVSSVSPD